MNKGGHGGKEPRGGLLVHSTEQSFHQVALQAAEVPGPPASGLRGILLNCRGTWKASLSTRSPSRLSASAPLPSCRHLSAAAGLVPLALLEGVGADACGAAVLGRTTFVSQCRRGDALLLTCSPARPPRLPEAGRGPCQPSVQRRKRACPSLPGPDSECLLCWWLWWADEGFIPG